MIIPDFAKQNLPEGTPNQTSKRFGALGGVIPTFCLHGFVREYGVRAKFGTMWENKNVASY